MLSALAAGLIRSIYIDGFYQFMKDIGGKRLDANILACLLNKLLNVLNLCFLYFDFFLQTDDLSFDTLYEHAEYEVIAAFYGKAIPKGEAGFRYYQYTDLTNPVAFDEYITQVKAAAVYDTGIAVEYGDELLLFFLQRE